MLRAFSRHSKRVVGALTLGALTLAGSPNLRAAGPPLHARVECAPATGPGRILCELTANVTSGKLVWADVLAVKAPAFARPLRSRVVAQVGADPEASASVKLALVASEPGLGELELRVRAVVCQEGSNGESCAPEVTQVVAAVTVAPAAPAASAP